jgi:F-type H+-transporting ATPase subunit b
MRHGFGLNTDLFETNVLNLAVVLGIVVGVVGDAVRDLLDQRREMIVSALQEADQKAADAQQRLEIAQKSVETASLRAQEIRTQALSSVEQETSIIRRQLEKDLLRLKERGRQAIQLEYQRAVQAVTQRISSLALTAAESKLLIIFNSQDQGLSKQRELNEMHVRETLCQLK